MTTLLEAPLPWRIYTNCSDLKVQAAADANEIVRLDVKKVCWCLGWTLLGVETDVRMQMAMAGVVGGVWGWLCGWLKDGDADGS